MMKKTVVLSLAALAAMSLAACGGDTAETTTAAATTAAETEAPVTEAETEAETEAVSESENGQIDYAAVFAELSEENPMIVDEKNKVVHMLCDINGKYFTESTGHGIVFKDGGNKDISIFRGYADEVDFYHALEQLGAKPGNNLTMDDMDAGPGEGKTTEGDKIEAVVTWEGQSAPVPLEEVLNMSTGTPLDLRFSGNLENAEKYNSGCVVCLNSCCVGIVSNAANPTGTWNDKNAVFQADESVLPGDGEKIMVSFSLAGSGKTAEAASETEVTEEQIFVPVDWVAEVVADQVPGYEDAIIAEASWGPVDQNEPYQTAHIPGAIHIDTDSVEDYDKYNIFPFEVLSENLAGYGITADTPLIVYGDDPSAASRVVLAASYAGVKNVKLMNGNMSTWTDAGNETEEGIVEPVAAEAFGAEEAAHPEYLISCADVREKIDSDENFRLVSIRSTEEFEGLTSGYSYIDYAGEPKGAVWGHAGVDPYDMSDYVNEDGTFVDYETVVSYMDEAGVSQENETAFYCGTGWRACVPFLILKDNGWDNVEVYDGGWYEWLMNPDYPVQVGDPASEDCIYTTVDQLEPGKAAK